jgi:drug/metabolite transporter (DMT)-like permease
MRLILLTLLTMIAFAANSVFGRLGLETTSGVSAIDPAGYTVIRLVSGALMLAVLVTGKNDGKPVLLLSEGNWFSAVALFGYAAAFSFSYVSIETGLGALILFACVQATMIGWSIICGDRPSLREIAGMVIAFTAFAWLVSPGLAAPDPIAAGLMALSGISWGVYSLLGKRAADPLRATAGNFIRAALPAVALALASIGITGKIGYSLFGVAMAIASGAFSSALGYALWYQVLKNLSATRAAIIQLSVPLFAGIGGLILLGEPWTARFAIASIFILGGVAIAIVGKARRTTV